MNVVVRDGKGRACNVGFGQIRKSLAEAGLPLGSVTRNLRASRAGLPNAKQPNPVETKTGEAIKVKIRDLVKLAELAEFLRTAIEPIADIDLKDGRIWFQRGASGCLAVGTPNARTTQGQIRNMTGPRCRHADLDSGVWRLTSVQALNEVLHVVVSAIAG